MSELRVAQIHNPNNQTGGITIGNDDNVSISGQAQPTAGAQGNRNLIINGAMQIAQRGDDMDDITTTGYRTCDRFRIDVNSLGTWTVQQSTESPDVFTNSLRMLCTTADASPAASDACLINYFVEGFDCQRLLDTGTTTHPMRLSFWVKSNRTGDASLELIQPDNSNKMFTVSYNIAAADTWEHKVIEIPADTAAVFDNNNGRGLEISWWLNSGSSFTGGTHSAGWVAFDQTARNCTNLGVGQAVDDEFCLTGVQLEIGTNATAFEWRPHAAELALCQRYFQTSFVQGAPRHGVTRNIYLFVRPYTGNNVAGIGNDYQVEMRAVPTIVTYTTQGGSGETNGYVSYYTNGSWSNGAMNPHSSRTLTRLTLDGGLDSAVVLVQYNYTADAEL